MSEVPVETVRRLFDLYAEGGLEAALDALHRELVIEVPPELSAEPDTYRGHDGARRYFAGFDGMLEGMRFEALELVPAAGEHVLVEARFSGRGVSSGVAVELQAAMAIRVSDGRVVWIRPFVDMESARRAVS